MPLLFLWIMAVFSVMPPFFSMAILFVRYTHFLFRLPERLREVFVPGKAVEARCSNTTPRVEGAAGNEKIRKISAR